MNQNTKFIKDLTKKEMISGDESLLIQDDTGTKQAPLDAIVNKVVEQSTIGVDEAIATFKEAAEQHFGNNQQQIDTFIEETQARADEALTDVDQINQKIAETNAQLSEVANKGTTVEVLERVTKEEIDRQIADGTIANLTIEDESITSEKLSNDSVTHSKIASGSIGYKHISLVENLLDVSSVTHNQMVWDGVLKSFQSYSVSDFIKVTPDDVITVSNGRPSSLGCMFNSNKEFVSNISGYSPDREGEPLQIRIPSGVSYIRINMATKDLDSNYSITTNGVNVAKDYQIPWLKIYNDNLNNDLRKQMEFLDTLCDDNYSFDLSAVPGYIKPIDNDGINLLNKDTVLTDRVIDGSGNTVSNSNLPYVYLSDYISVKGNRLYTISCDKVGNLLDEYDLDKKLIKHHSGRQTEDGIYSFTTTGKTRYVRFNITTKEQPLSDYYFIKGTELKDDLNSNQVGNLFDKNNYVSTQFTDANGILISNSNFPTVGCTGYLKVNPSSSYTINFEAVTHWLSEYDSNKNFIKHHTGKTGVEPRTITTTSQTHYIVANINTDLINLDDYYVSPAIDTNDESLGFDFPTFSWLEERLELLEKDNPSTDGYSDFMAKRFYGMNVLVTGDSITEKNFRASKNWHDYLKDWYGFNKVYNDGKSGSGLVKNGGIIYRIPTWDNNYGSDIDMILIMGPMNDGTSGVTGQPSWLGSFDDQDDSMKENSLYGALHYTCKELIKRYPNIPIGFIISQPRSQVGSQGKCWGIDGWFERWVQAINEVCGHYSIPVLDLYHNSGLRPWNADNNAKYFSCSSSPLGDGIHPNDLGQELMARKIYEFINRYM